MADEKKDALATQEPVGELMNFDDVQAVTSRPKSLEYDESGTEDIDPDRVRLPRLAIAQGLSPQMTPGDSQFIEGLAMFDMFNDMTGDVYGKGPITFVPVKHETKRIEFIPRTEGGGVADLNVPKGDQRLKWTKSNPSLTKADTPPKATEIEQFVVVLLRRGKQPEPIVFGIALKNKWNRRAAEKIIATVKLRRGTPIYANMFTVDTKVPAKNDQGTFGVPTIRDLGFVPKDTPSGAALFQFCKDFHDSLEGKNIESNLADDNIDDSMAANPEEPNM
jgi:hypothetical protein